MYILEFFFISFSYAPLAGCVIFDEVMRLWRVVSLWEGESLLGGYALRGLSPCGRLCRYARVCAARVNYLARKISKKKWITQISLIFCEKKGTFIADFEENAKKCLFFKQIYTF